MENFRTLLKRENSLLIADGAMGSLLAARGRLGEAPPELLNRDDPAVIEAIHRDYIAAGAVIIVSNTFGANAFKLDRTGHREAADELNRRGAAIARRAADRSARPVFVAGSLGPSGELPAPLGTVSAAALTEAFRRQARALVAGGADLLLIETMSAGAEARAALEAVRAESDLPVVLSFTFTPGQRGPRTLMGESPADLAAAFGDQVDCLGANCGEGPEVTAEICARYRDAGQGATWAKPNAGRPILRAGETVYPLDAPGFAACLPALAGAGARVVGGCCGCGPGHIAALARAAAAGPR